MIGALWGTTLTSIDPALQNHADEINRWVRELTTGITDLAMLAGQSLNDCAALYVGGCWVFESISSVFFAAKGTDIWSAISPLGSSLTERAIS